MVCIYCGGASRVSNSRSQKKLNRVWRRRNCLSCSAVWTTIEKLDETGALAVKRPARGQIETFAMDKLFISVYESCRHRKDAAADARALTNTIFSRLLAPKKRSKIGLIDINELKNISEQVLQRFDNTAYVHYRAYFGTDSQ
jgi:transcriptional regulator NrdR family protein